MKKALSVAAVVLAVLFVAAFVSCGGPDPEIAKFLTEYKGKVDEMQKALDAGDVFTVGMAVLTTETDYRNKYNDTAKWFKAQAEEYASLNDKFDALKAKALGGM